jgi:beta-fructofuranosidase
LTPAAQRPVLHITPPRGWLNDPNGLVHWQGIHHVFHQANPDSVSFGTMTWGHVSGTDLVRWTREELALVPSQPADRDGCWTGCVVDADGTATAIYTGAVAAGDGRWTQTVCLATATDASLRTWRKHPGNPLDVPAPGFETAVFRDPYVWRDGDGWAMLLGSSLPSREGALLLYRSPDLFSWAYRGVAVRGGELPGGLPTGTLWECPSLIPVSGGRHLLVFSVSDVSDVSDPDTAPVLRYPVAVTGRFDGARFRPEQLTRFDHGHDCYAPAVETTEDGRFLAYGWSGEGLTDAGRETQGWSGCLTLPREIGLRGGQVSYTPAADLSHLRSEHWQEREVSLGPPLEGGLGSSVAEIRLAVRMGDAGGFDLAVRCSPDQEEQTVIRYRVPESSLEFDRSRSSTWPQAIGGVSRARYPLPASGVVELTLILDHSVAELYAGDTVVMTERIYPQRPDSSLVRLEATGGTATVARLDVWELVPTRNAGR